MRSNVYLRRKDESNGETTVLEFDKRSIRSFWIDWIVSWTILKNILTDFNDTNYLRSVSQAESTYIRVYVCKSKNGTVRTELTFFFFFVFPSSPIVSRYYFPYFFVVIRLEIDISFLLHVNADAVAI